MSEPIMLSASIGVTLFPDDDADPDTLIRHADQAMYQAKQAGRNRYHLFDYEFDRHIRIQHERMDRIEKGLKHKEFVLYYQPKVNMRKGTVTGAEALIRWHHPERGVVAPGEFMPFIEDHDLSVRIGEWVIETAVNQLDEWQQRNLNITVNINVAGYHLQSPSFVQYLSSQLVNRPHLGKNIEIEILETSALEDIAKVLNVIEQCRELGICFALDDFGTGYSSLTYLKRLPVSTIKIDQSFIKEMTSDPNNFIIVQGILGLSSAFQRQVIAEGVETVEQGRMLMQLNCDHAQGYGIARPMPASDFLDWTANWSPYPEWGAIKNLVWESDDSSIFVARIELINWVSQLIYAIKEEKPVPHKCADDYHQCNFGIWYYGFATHKYQHLACFKAIEKPHIGLHEVVGQIDFLWRSGQHNQIKTLISDLLNQRNAVIEALTELEMGLATAVMDTYIEA
jgi:EAL domain-containing protein (putative c-di-GMP-specific phosphodiesterase class I)